MSRFEGFCLMLTAVAMLSGCTGQVSQPQNQQAQQASAVIAQQCAKGQCPCNSPIGSIASGSNVIVYDTNNVSCDDTCSSHGTTVTCTNGKFSQDVSQMSFTCDVSQCVACTLGSNLIPNNETVTLYNTNVVDCGLSCQDAKEERTCFNGTLSGDTSYNQTNCVPRVCDCRLPDNTGSVTLNGTATLYSAQTAACGQTCSQIAQVRTCESQGTGDSRTFFWSGSSSFQYTTCQEASGCACTLPNNLGQINNGQTYNLSATAQVPCGQTCDSQNVTVACNNGVLTQVSNGAVVNIATTNLKYECTVANCQLCQVNAQISVPNGQTYTFYNASSSACGQQCSDISEVRTCVNGTFNGNTSYSYPSCSTRLCKCALPDNSSETIPVGQSIVLYSALRPQCGQTCPGISQSFTCTEQLNNGVYTYVFPGSSGYQHSTCGPAQGCSCPMPAGIPAISDGKTTTLSSVQQATCPTACSQTPSITVTCVGGVLQNTADNSIVNINAPGFQYPYQCQDAVCTDCPLPGYGSIPNNSTITLYSKATLDCGDNINLLTYSFSCQASVLYQNGVVYTPPNGTPPTWYTSITPNCTGCPFAGLTIAQGATVWAYKGSGNAGNTCGQGCKSQQQTCNNGVMSGDPSYNMSSCSSNCSQEGGGAPPRLCLLPWQNSFVTPDAQIPMWSRNTVPCGDSCQNYFKVGKCQMATGTFDVGFQYIYQSCTELCSH
jgi:hypothetical protein